MKKTALVLIILLVNFREINAQSFVRSELLISLDNPWEILYGPDGFLWLSESGGKVSRVDPSNGNRTVVYTAPDYFGGAASEASTLCHQPAIQKGTLGMALHPDFMDSTKSFIYYVYSYNSGTSGAPATKFKLKRLKWDANSNTVVADSTIVANIVNGYDHIGGRLMAIKRNNIPYLFLTVGDNGISDDGAPDCYNPQSTNPNNFAQDPTTQNGKVHRFLMDGSIPADNPIAGNSFYTRGHRNPQGLMYNHNLDILYDIEHGDKTDDEINILNKGMNYGWKHVRGYHSDNNHPGEAAYISNYTANASIANDSLVEAFYSWCATTADTTSNYLDWCTVAPSGGSYYGSTAIPEWTNSLLVVTLKDGTTTDRELYQFKLQSNGELAPSTPSDPNPKKFFGADQALNGRLRDIAISPDGKKIYLIHNGGAANKITIYTYDPNPSSVQQIANTAHIKLYPNPAQDKLNIEGVDIEQVQILTLLGKTIPVAYHNNQEIDISHLNSGVYFVNISSGKKLYTLKFIKA